MCIFGFYCFFDEFIREEVNEEFLNRFCKIKFLKYVNKMFNLKM